MMSDLLHLQHPAVDLQKPIHSVSAVCTMQEFQSEDKQCAAYPCHPCLIMIQAMPIESIGIKPCRFNKHFGVQHLRKSLGVLRLSPRCLQIRCQTCNATHHHATPMANGLWQLSQSLMLSSGQHSASDLLLNIHHASAATRGPSWVQAQGFRHSHNMHFQGGTTPCSHCQIRSLIFCELRRAVSPDMCIHRVS